MRDVVAGRIIACKWVKLACQRHLDDLKRSRTAKFAYKYEPARAERACGFIEKLPHVKGKWADQRENLKLSPWQVFVVCSLFGWVHKRTGKYRFRIAYIEVPRKNAKSTLAAAIGLYKFCADSEYGAEVYSGATTEKQAWEVFRPAHQMVSRTPQLKAAFGISTPVKQLIIQSNGSRFEPVIGKPGDGASPSCAIVDEYHEHQTDDLWDTMITGMGARENPLQLGITTAGSDLAGPCYALNDECKKVLQGAIDNDQLFAIIYTIDEGDEWTSELALKKANPNYEVSVSAEFLRIQQRDAINSARKQNIFKTKHLDIWCNAAVGWMNMEDWGKCADPSLRIEQFIADPCIEAFDLASKIDIASRVKVFRRVGDPADPSKDHFYVFARHYLNEVKIEQSKGSHYEGWVNAGKLVKTSGNITDYKQIGDEIVTDSTRFNVREVPLDMRDAGGIISFIQASPQWNQAIQFVEVPQTVAMLSPAMKEVEALVLSRRLHHDGDPVLAWMISNVIVKEDHNGNIFPRKQTAENKIDGAVALFMCMNRWSAQARLEPTGAFEIW